MKVALAGTPKIILVSALLSCGFLLLWFRQGKDLYLRYEQVSFEKDVMEQRIIQTTSSLNISDFNLDDVKLDLNLNPSEHENRLFSLLQAAEGLVDFEILDFGRPKPVNHDFGNANLSSVDLRISFEDSMILLSELDKLNSGLFIVSVEYSLQERRKNSDNSLILKLTIASFEIGTP